MSGSADLGACERCGGRHGEGELCPLATDPRLGVVVAGKYQLVRLIGHGGMGVAYGVGPQKVLKVTTDDKEARSSMTVMDLSPESDVFPKFYDVFGFQSVGDQTLYGILQEQLEKPAQKWETFGKLWLEWRKRAMSLVYDENLKVRKGVSYDEAVQHKKAYEADLNFDNIVEFARWLAAREGVGVRDIRSKYAEELEWLMHASEELARADIRYWDFKAQNLMARKGKPVLIDLGVSDSPTPLKSVRVLGEVLDDLAERISMPRKIRTL